MRKNRMKELLRQGKVPLGMWLDLVDPHVVEMAGYVGFDFVCLECEHTLRDPSQLETLIYAADVAQIPVIVRMRELNTELIVKVLAAGAMGVMLAHTQTKEDAIKLVRAAKYPPQGVRGMNATVRATQFGTDNSVAGFAQFAKMANEETLVCAIVEDRQGVENCEEIAAVEGLDGVLYGPGDLALDTDIPDESYLDAMRERIVKANRDHGKSSWFFVIDAADTADVIKQGANVVVFVHDILQLRLLCENALKTMRAAVEQERSQ